MKIEREFVSESGNIRVEIIQRYDGKWTVTWWNRDEITSEQIRTPEAIIELMFRLIDEGYTC